MMLGYERGNVFFISNANNLTSVKSPLFT